MTSRILYSWALFTLLCLPLHTTVAAESTPDRIDIEATTHLGDRQVFIEGDLIAFLVTLEQDAYITAIYQDAENNLVQIIPNSRQRDNFYHADLFIPVPPQDAGFSFRVQAPYGKETLWLFATDSAAIELDGTRLSSGLKRLNAGIDVIRDAIRNSADRSYGETSVTINTRAR